MTARKATPGIAQQATATGNAANTSALQGVRTKIIEVNKSTTGKSQAVPDDPFKSLADNGGIIEPPFDMLTLSMLNEHSTELNQCVEAMVTNIEGFGHRFQSRLTATPGEDVPGPIKAAVKKERVRLENFFAYCTKESYVSFRGKLRKDLEQTGCAYYEVIRSASGQIQSFVHLPSYQMRLGKLDENMVETQRPMLELQEDGSVKVATIPEWRRFRRYVQSRTINNRQLEVQTSFKMRYFKEFGDARTINNKNGEVATGKLGINDKANEVVYLNLYSARSPYGLPRYIGNLLSIFGDRAAEEINFITFRNNNVPSMVIAVSNGQLTEGSVGRIESFVESQIQGSDNYSKFLILEAETMMEGEDGAQMKLDIKPLVSQQHKDELFQEYSKNNQDKIRRCFRLPPIFVGRAVENTGTTVESSRRLADEQVFAPERDNYDAFINRNIFPDMGIVYHKFKTNSPNTTDNTQLVKILANAEKTGGMTPRVARIMLEDILGFPLPEFAKGFDPDVPFSLTMAEAVKNQADVTEPGQQVTALKSSKSKDPMVEYLLEVQKNLSREWEGGLEDDEDDQGDDCCG